MKFIKLSQRLVLLSLILLSLQGISVNASPGPVTDSLDSLSNSNVTFDLNHGGDACYVRGNTQYFCFAAVSATTDGENATDVYLRFGAGWIINYGYRAGSHFCLQGGDLDDASFSATVDPYNLVKFHHIRWHHVPGDTCTAYYCVNVTSSGALPAPAVSWVSWYWTGSGLGISPHHPCSTDGYTPPGQEACDQSVNNLAEIPACNLDFIPISLYGL